MNQDYSKKVLLNVNEASEYFGIGVSKMRELMNSSCSCFVLLNGSKRLIKREQFEKWLLNQESI